MKKTISILLIVAMMLAATLAIIPVSAASGDKITSAADFAAMKADGKYYLANDIDATNFTMPKYGTGYGADRDCQRGRRRSSIWLCDQSGNCRCAESIHRYQSG